MICIAISNAMRAALRALSDWDVDIKKNYKLKRQLETAAAYSPFYKPWDHEVLCDGRSVPVRLFAPEPGKEPEGVLLFFHGGGWVTGNIDSYDKVCQNMQKQTGYTVVSVDYRLAPEYPFPAAPEDCYAVVREVFSDATLFGVPPEKIVLIGDSAGGNLAAAVSLMARDRGEFLPAKQILIYPAVYNDHSEQSPYSSVQENGTDYLLTSKRIRDYMDLYEGGHPESRDNPYFAPLLAQDFSRQPDTLVITAQYDPLRDEGEDYAVKLKAAGNRVSLRRIPDALHGYFSLSPAFSQVAKTYRFINAFLRGELS